VSQGFRTWAAPEKGLRQLLGQHLEVVQLMADRLRIQEPENASVGSSLNEVKPLLLVH
jgi:hypothetical protein